MGNFKYFTKFPVYRVNKIYLIVTAGQLSRLERRANNAMSWVRPPHWAKFFLYVQE